MVLPLAANGFAFVRLAAQGSMRVEGFMFCYCCWESGLRAGYFVTL
jgi:hypothetical protein